MEEEKIVNIVKDTLSEYFKNEENKQKEIEQNKLQEQEEILKTKSIEFYSQSVNAWYLTALEKDKTIFIFSMAGIGFMITLLTTKVIYSYLTLALLFLAVVSFLTSTITIIRIFGLNKEYLNNVMNERNSSHIKLKNKDYIAMVSFIVGIIFSIALGIIVAMNNISVNNL
ncbi:hypothetical protein [Aliarcobacter cryaerophilus]|uniref:hypothetical protein n=1 Tax=Aliarcobacter cryaerophilus TaxID=28198 RepID=UPI003DA5B93B